MSSRLGARCTLAAKCGIVGGWRRWGFTRAPRRPSASDFRRRGRAVGSPRRSVDCFTQTLLSTRVLCAAEYNGCGGCFVFEFIISIHCVESLEFVVFDMCCFVVCVRLMSVFVLCVLMFCCI